MPSKIFAASLFEYTLIAAGWYLAWRVHFSARVRGQRPVAGLGHWNISLQSYLAAALCVFGSWVFAQVAAASVVKAFPILQKDTALMVIVGGSLAQLSLIAGGIGAALYLRKAEPTDKSISPASLETVQPKRQGVLVAALVTCIITLSIVYPVQVAWEYLLKVLHLPTEKQEMIDIFFQTASPLRLAGLSLMAVVLAPISEELVFRAGLFRYFRGRLPRWAALALPSLMFAALHVGANMKGLVTVAPLTALGIIFSLAYERTGRISVAILAHALFNLHTVVFLLLGLDT